MTDHRETIKQYNYLKKIRMVKVVTEIFVKY